MDSFRILRFVRRRRQREVSHVSRLLRDSADPLSLDSDLFIRYYRVTKTLFIFLCSVLGDRLRVSQRCTSITTELKILTTLNFLATGSYQMPVGRDWLAPVSQPTVSRCIHEVVEALNVLLSTYVRFPSSVQEKNKVKQRFYEKFGIPGVLGCVDGTLVAILAPRNHPSEAAFFTRKGYHAINAAIICDSDLKILGICAKFGGAAHDSYVWRSWSISRYLEEEYNSGETGWLLADSGYPQKPYLMTPVLHTSDNTPEAHYTNLHVRTRVCVERCIGLLKARWRCLLRHRVLHYEPTKCAKIINACAVLHNLCLDHGISMNNSDDLDLIDDIAENDSTISVQPGSGVGIHARQQLIDILWQNRTLT